MEPVWVSQIAPMALAIMGVVALKLYLDARHRDRAAGDPQVIHALRTEIATLNADLATERRRRAAYEGRYNAPPPDIEYPEEGEEGLGELAESLVGKLPGWAKPLLDSPQVQNFVLDKLTQNPQLLDSILTKLTARPLPQTTNNPTTQTL